MLHCYWVKDILLFELVGTGKNRAFYVEVLMYFNIERKRVRNIYCVIVWAVILVIIISIGFKIWLIYFLNYRYEKNGNTKFTNRSLSMINVWGVK